MVWEGHARTCKLKLWDRTIFGLSIFWMKEKKKERDATFLFNLLIQDMGQKQPNPILNFLSSQTQKVLFVHSFPPL